MVENTSFTSVMVQLEKTTTGSSKENESDLSDYTNFYGSSINEQLIVGLLIAISAYLATVTVAYCIMYPHKTLRLSNSLISVSAVMLFVQCFWFEVEIAIDEYNDIYCTAYTVINVIFATVMRNVIYIVLWLRQQGIYSNPLQRLDGKKHKMISRITLAGILTFAFFQIIVLTVVPQNATISGCESGRSSGFLSVITPIVFTVSSFFQIVLLGLTLYPVVTHVTSEVALRNRKKENLHVVAIKLSICTAICVIDDIIFMIVIQTKPGYAPASFIPYCYAYNTAINTFATLMSFVNFKLRLCPFKKSLEKQRSTQQQTPSHNLNSASRNVVQ